MLPELSSVAHVVTGHLQASAQASHQAGMHGPETAEVNGVRNPEFLGCRFYVSVKQVVPVKRLASPVGVAGIFQ